MPGALYIPYMQSASDTRHTARSCCAPPLFLPESEASSKGVPALLPLLGRAWAGASSGSAAAWCASASSPCTCREPACSVSIMHRTAATWGYSKHRQHGVKQAFRHSSGPCRRLGALQTGSLNRKFTADLRLRFLGSALVWAWNSSAATSSCV